MIKNRLRNMNVALEILLIVTVPLEIELMFTSNLPSPSRNHFQELSPLFKLTLMVEKSLRVI